MGPDYPSRIWTKFESEQFKSRFGENAVIPIWFAGQDYGAFDISRAVGGETIDRSKPLSPQVAGIAERLGKKLTEHRIAGTSAA